MELQELKQQITDGTVSDGFKIFKYSENTYLAEQYIDEICSRNGKIKTVIHDLYETSNDAISMIFDSSQNLNVLRVDTFDTYADSYEQFDNIIVVCKSVDKKIADYVEQYITEFPKMTDWQVQAFMKYYCSGISDEGYAWLYETCFGDIYKILNELDKIKLFDEPEREKVLLGMKNDAYTDLYAVLKTDISNAIANKDLYKIYDFLKHKNSMVGEDRGKDKSGKPIIISISPEFDPISMINLVLSRYKTAAYASSGRTPDDLDMNQWQLNYARRDANTYDYDLKKMIPFLSNLDLRLKDNKLDADSNVIVDYLICHIFA